MTINISMPNGPEVTELKPRIIVIGVGGAGGNAVNNMINANLEGVEFIAANTDAQALGLSKAHSKLQLGIELTRGLGAGARAEIGRGAAEENLDDVRRQMDGANMVFIAAGMGGGTGTGAAPVIASAAREQGILTVGVVTKPFQFEGVHRMRIAENGIEELEQYVDTLIIIPNQNLFRVANEKTTFADAFAMADDVLYSGVRGVTDLMVMPGLINLDFADVRSVMGEMGKAMMGTGEAEGDRRALEAAEAAISNPLLDDASMKGAKGVLINITGGSDMTLFEVDEAANRIRAEVDEDAYIIFGSAFDDTMQGKMRVSVVATGIDGAAVRRPIPEPVRGYVAVAQAPVNRQEEDLETPQEPMAATETPAAPRLSDLIEQEEPVFTIEEMAAASAPGAAPEEPDMDDGQDDDGQDAFIPPEPVLTRARAATSDAEPFAEAAMANGAGLDLAAPEPEAKPKKLSLFEQITGLGAGRDKVPAQKPALDPFGTEPRAGFAAPMAAVAAEPAFKVVEQQSLGALSQEQPEPHADDDSLLDIPAFLRRQAN